MPFWICWVIMCFTLAYSGAGLSPMWEASGKLAGGVGTEKSLLWRYSVEQAYIQLTVSTLTINACADKRGAVYRPSKRLYMYRQIFIRGAEHVRFLCRTRVTAHRLGH